MSEQDDGRAKSGAPFESALAPYGPQRITSNAGLQSAEDTADLETTGTIAFETSWAGPLPPPSLLAEYGEIVPSGAARIFDQFEAEAAHRRYLERREVTTRRLDLLGGQTLVGIFILGAYVVTAIAIAKNALWVAGIIGSLTTVLTIFFSARYRGKSKEEASEDP